MNLLTLTSYATISHNMVGTPYKAINSMANPVERVYIFIMVKNK